MDRDDDLDRDERIRNAVYCLLPQHVGTGVDIAALRTFVLEVDPRDVNPYLRLPAPPNRELLEFRQVADRAPFDDQVLPDHLKSVQLLCILSHRLHMVSFLFLVERRNYMQSFAS